MKNPKLQYVIVILALLITASVVNALKYDGSHHESHDEDIFQTIPQFFDTKWKGEDYPLEEVVYDILETKTILHRSYTNKEGKGVFLSIVHYADTKVDFHAPEACFGGSGLETKKTIKTLELSNNGQQQKLNIAQLESSSSFGNSLTYYFYKTGDFIGSNYIKMRLSIAANKLIRNDTIGSLVRISTQLLPGQEDEAQQLLKDFLVDFLPHMQKTL